MFPAGKCRSGDFNKHHLYLQMFVCFPFILSSSSFTQQAIRRLLQSWNNVRFVWHHRFQPSQSSGATKLFESKMGLNLQEPVVTAEPQTLWMPSTCFMVELWPLTQPVSPCHSYFRSKLSYLHHDYSWCSCVQTNWPLSTAPSQDRASF